MRNNWIFVLVLLGISTRLAHADANGDKPDKCITVRGTFAVWNGWSPFERIESSDHKRVFGIESAFDGDDVPMDRTPDNLKEQIGKEDPHFTGIFIFCLNSQKTGVPYDKRPIELGWIKSFKPTD